jgi:nicotinate-nucleotide adenylyltransferase
MRIGLFFGSFNPIHVGHLILANTLYDRTDLNEVWFVVSPQNPFKKQQSLIHEFDRLRMVELAIADHYHFRASDVEFRMPRPSYTQHQFCLFLGSDNLTHFHKWKNYQAILDNYEIFVYPRPGASQAFDHPKIKTIEAPLLDISATFVRKSIQEGYSVKYLLPGAVEEYILDKKLYL